MPVDAAAAYAEWSASMYEALGTNFVEADCAVLNLPTGSCLASASATIFSVDLDAFETLCTATTGCAFNSADYKPVALGVRFT